jgi:hypothetical protein
MKIARKTWAEVNPGWNASQVHNELSQPNGLLSPTLSAFSAEV